MFALELRLLTGRYVATQYNDRSAPEWPPHPARLYSALAATHFAVERPDPAERDALEWMEGLGAPELTVSDAFPRDEHVVFVPVNDITVVGDFGKQEWRVHEAREKVVAFRRRLESLGPDAGKERSRLVKELARAEKAAGDAVAKLRAAIEKQTAPGRPGKGDASRAAALLPADRTRQPRRFPGVTPEEDVVHFVWRDVNGTSHAEVLDRLASRVVRLGHSSSFVSLRVVPEAPAATYTPVEAGSRRFRVITAGQLRRLEDAYVQHRETEPRIMPNAFQDYDVHRPEPAAQPASVFAEDWLTLERVSGPMLAATRAPDMARAVRRALLAHAKDPPPEILSGHGPDGAPSRDAHVAFVPIPFVGHMHADGQLRGIAIVLPRRASLPEKMAVYRAQRAWEEASRRADEDAPELALQLGALGVLKLRRVDQSPRLKALRAQTWCGPSKAWATVSPIALDRNPGNLASRDPGRLADAIRAAEATVREACERIELPDPTRVVILPFAPVAGSYKAKHFGPFPREETRTQRVLTHAYIEFAEPVLGPVMLGAGRFAGLGLFKPISEA